MKIRQCKRNSKDLNGEFHVKSIVLHYDCRHSIKNLLNEVGINIMATIDMNNAQHDCLNSL